MNKSRGVAYLFLVLAAWLVVPSNGQAVFGLFGQNQVVKAAYEKLRPMAKKHTEAAIPRVSRMVAKYATAAGTPTS